MHRLTFVALVTAACGDPSSGEPDAAPLTPTPNPAREVIATNLSFDVTLHTAMAVIELGPSAEPGATLEIGDLGIQSVAVGEAALAFRVADKKLDLALPASDGSTSVAITYMWNAHEGFEGASANGYTLIWPYFCGNLFPCHSDPADGTTFTLALSGIPAGKTAVFPATIAAQAPSYQIAWSIDEYTDLPLGTTTAGTQIVMSHRPNEAARAAAGGANLVAAFDWMEKTIGPYRFGNVAGGVSVRWPAGAFGGMEHHPRWHVAAAALGDEETQVHEAAHGWFGDGIRIRCWEDFVLSEGTVTYLAGRALDVVAPAVGAAVWTSYANEVATVRGTDPVWPQSCGRVDVIADNLFTRAPYLRGAFFYRGLADRLGAGVVDQVLAAFYTAHAGGAATMADMLSTIQTVTGYDATACADTWLKSTTTPAPGPCP
ncbi:MAG: peptidase M1 [Deltaproteobacteria bacterium]|nr:peptidase M1 [Deltaproteobacteria bacterium]